MSVSSPLLIYPAHSAMSGFPQSALSSKTPFMFDSNFTFSFTTFHFLMRCIFVGWYRLLSVQFCKMSPGFIPGDRWHHYLVCCPCMNWVTGTQWPLPAGLWIVMGLVSYPDARYIVVCGLKSWPQGEVCVSCYCDNGNSCVLGTVRRLSICMWEHWKLKNPEWSRNSWEPYFQRSMSALFLVWGTGHDSTQRWVV